MSAGSCHLCRPPGHRLPFDIRKVGTGGFGFSGNRQDGGQRQDFLAPEVPQYLLHRVGGIDRKVREHRSLGGIGPGDYDAGQSPAAGIRHHREDSVHRAQVPVQREFPHQGQSLGQGRQRPGGTEDSHQNGQVVDGAGLFGVGRGEVHHHPAGREFHATVFHGGAHPVLGFLDGGIGQADDFKTGESPAHIRLHGDGVAGEAGESEAADTGKHDGIPSF